METWYQCLLLQDAVQVVFPEAGRMKLAAAICQHWLTYSPPNQPAEGMIRAKQLCLCLRRNASYCTFTILIKPTVLE